MDKKKVLIFPGGLHIGGAERVAANISKYAPDYEFEFHYLTFDCHENVYGPEIEEKGGKVFSVPLPKKGYLAYIKTLHMLMKEHRYVAVHSHTMFNSGINLAVAKLHRIPVRIAHSHTTKTETPVSFFQKMYEFLMRKVIVHTGTHWLACGVEAGKWLFGKNEFETKGIVLRNGIDTEAFAWSQDSREKIRKQYGLDDAFVIGHTGTLTRVKNQEFLIRLLPQVLASVPNAVLMLVGGNEGDNLTYLQSVAREYRVEEKVIFTGAVLNVNEYLSAFDVFAFPSTREGTPLSLLEAQANGIPCIVSENIPRDAFLTNLIKTLPLDKHEAWVENICSAKRKNPEIYCDKIKECGYDSASAYAQIYDIYRGMNIRKKAMVSLSFDDGRGDNTKVLDELLLPRGIPATINITTGYIDGSCPSDLRPSDKKPMEKADVIRFANNPLIEIGLHGDQHKNTPEDVLAGRNKLLEWMDVNEDHVFGFASPKAKLSPEEWRSAVFAEVSDVVCYMRASLRVSTLPHTRILFRKMGRILHLPVFYRIAYKDTKMTFRDGQIVYSVQVLKDITLKQVQALLEDCMKCGAAVVLVFHSVLEDCSNEDNWSWDRGKFEGLCDYLVKKRDQGAVEVITTKSMYERMK